MVIETLPEASERRAAEDWRTGLFQHRPGHVFGATALTQQEWRQRAHECDRRGLRFVGVSSATGFNFVSPAKSWAATQADLASSVRLAPEAFAPAGRLRYRVIEVSEWDRVQEGRS